MIYYVLFRIVDVRLAFPLVDVQEILPRPILTSTPGMPSLLAGEFMPGDTVKVTRAPGGGEFRFERSLDN